MAKKPRNYAATDITLINLRTLKRKLAALTVRVAKLEKGRA